MSEIFIRCFASYILVLLTCFSCTTVSLTGYDFACTKDSDCDDGQICGSSGGARVCVPQDLSNIRIGMTGPFQGPSADLGNEMRRGIQVAFDRVNADDGVFGRHLELVTQNDNYDPVQAQESITSLLDIEQVNPDLDSPDVRGPDSVFAILGSVGTPTMLVTAPIATKNHVVFFAPYTGAQKYLRDDTNSPYVFNYRAGYFEETQAMVDYVASQRIPRVITDSDDSFKRLLVFQQNDTFGDSGYNGVVYAYNRIHSLKNPTDIHRITYERENLATVDPAVEQAKLFLQGSMKDTPTSIAVILVSTYQPANIFIRDIKDWLNQDAKRASLLDVVFMNVSFVGSDSLSKSLLSPPSSYSDVLNPGSKLTYADGVMVMQVVPYYGSQASAVVDYRRDIDVFDGGAYSHTSLEGYIVARLFTQSLNLTGADLTTDHLLSTLNTKVMGLDIGIGPLMNFSPDNHQASHTVWGSRLESNGTFSVPFIWNPSDHIIPN